jgi:hypothetical protein
MARHCLCVYAIVGSRARAAGRGIAGETLRVIRVASLAAIVGPHARRPDATRATLVGYDAVIRRLADRLPAVLPARFGTTVAEADEMVMILSARQAVLRRALAHVRNRVQMTVRLRTGEPDTPVSSRKAIDPAAPPTGAQFLRARAAAAAEQQRVAGSEPLRTAVGRWVRDERVDKRAGIASVYHLIPRRSVDAYRRAIQEAAAGSAVRPIISGPFPPYAFATTF